MPSNTSSQPATPFLHSVPFRAGLGACLVWLAFPPCGLWFLAPIGIACWFRILQQEQPLSRRDYRWIWLASFAMWLGLLQGIRLAYWPLYAGWFALSAYLAIYVPLWISWTRYAHRTQKWPLLIAAPTLWIGFECFRAYFLTGFAGCLLGHCMAPVPVVIQIAEHLGTYGVSGAIILAGMSLAAIPWPRQTGQSTEKPIGQGIFAGLLALLVVGYGWYQLQRSPSASESKPLLRVALIQENSPTLFEANFERNIRSFDNYIEQTRLASQEHGPLDIVVWPESVFSRNEPVFEWTTATEIPIEFRDRVTSRDQLEQVYQRIFQEKAMRLKAASTAGNPTATPPYCLVGCDVLRATDQGLRVVNAALWIGPEGDLKSYYAKTHLVMFGEYIPFGRWFQKMMGMGIVVAGDSTEVLKCQKVNILPSICFESMVPHAIHQHFVEARTQKYVTPDIMINITNDGWFHGSSILDHHLACGTLAAVENRCPMLIAANTGLSAWIDANGVRKAISRRLEPGYLLAEPTRDTRHYGLWRMIGDWPARGCAILTLGLILVHYARHFTRRLTARKRVSPVT